MSKRNHHRLRRGISLHQAQRIQRQREEERQQRQREYFRRVEANEDISDMNVDNDFDMSDRRWEGEAEIQGWEGGQE